jgi:hypothetical protein
MSEPSDHADGDGDRQRNGHQRQRAGEALADQLGDRHAIARREAEAEMGEVIEVVIELLEHGIIEAETLAQRRHGFFRR